ncbi:MAG TPA: hypothetical protein VLB44_03345 [Kofleriaceae bacterium]|nr:hypothetical protein [Kofleriaceae bacterium]
MNETWSALAHYVSRYRGALLGGIGSAAAVALTLDPAASIARSSVRFALWFAIVATILAVLLTATLSVAEYRASRPNLPRATARRTRRSVRVGVENFN